MNFYDLPGYINDAKCATADKAYHATVEIMAEAQPLITAAEVRIKYLADSVRVWAESIKEYGLTEETIYDAGYLNSDNDELQRIFDILVEVNNFKKLIASNADYQKYMRQTV